MISYAVWLYVRWFCRKFCSGGHAGQLPLSVEEMRQPGRRRGLSMNGAENWESVATVEALQKMAQSFLRMQKMTQTGISSRVKELNSAHVVHCLSGRCNTTVPL
jgi:hypothetical protein